MTKTLSGDQARVAAQQWLECESDLNNCQEIEALLVGPESDLIERFTGHLEFGTAGLRGSLGAGPQRMNRSLVQMTAAAIAQRLLQENHEEPPLVVIGFDARTQSDVFASDTARVLANQNIRCVLLPKALPTPVLAFLSYKSRRQLESWLRLVTIRVKTTVTRFIGKMVRRSMHLLIKK